ncbi:fumarylacetoacetate hydrolase family protein [Mycolicibacterium hodleri]|nr:fumarylacetoacetate hydrolase family protein [Mycolicibacterium hodleri]
MTQLFDLGGAVARRAGAMLEVLGGCDSLNELIVTQSLSELEHAPAIDRVPLADVRFVAPVRPTRLFHVGLNYHSHLAELGVPTPKRPVYAVAASGAALADPDSSIRIPSSNPHEIDYEAELAVVLGASASGVVARNAWNVVAGITAANDVSARDLQRLALGTGDLTAGKMLPGFKPLGPGLLTDAAHAGPISIRLSVNGTVRQSDDSSQMVFSVPELIEIISRDHALQPGDVILTGSPAGIGLVTSNFLHTGDVVTVTLGPLPMLRNVFHG